MKSPRPNAGRPHRPRRRFGQHFLVDEGALAGIAELVNPGVGTLALEVGPGRGALTHHLLPRLERLVAVEIDRDLHAELERRYGSDRRLRLVEGDVLELDLHALLREEGKEQVVVVGNIPYNITAPLLFRLIAHFDIVAGAVLTVQREVARRLVASPGSRDYGLLSVLLATRAQTHLRLNVDRSRFRPVPRVDSAVVELDVADEPRVAIADAKGFDQLVRAAFSQRRKMLRNALKALVASLAERHAVDAGVAEEWMQEAAREASIDLGRRAETLAVEEYAQLSNSLGRAVASGPAAGVAVPAPEPPT